ncbi:MAG: hypothetical protein O3C51_04985 [Planctomycetota bacterium]|nr:hypothetical protein [Planctomycetota bacterium]
MFGRPQPRARARRWALVAGACLALGLLVRALVGGGGSGPPLAPENTASQVVPDAARSVPRTAESPAPTASQGVGHGPGRSEAPQGFADGPPGRLRFRVLTPDGEPATARIVVRGSWLDRDLPLEPDGQGQCVLDLAADSDDEPERSRARPAPGASASIHVVQAATTARRRGPGEATLGPSADAGFTWPDAGRDVDLGVLLLAHAPVLVGGKLLSPDGRPITPNGAVRWSVQVIDDEGALERDLTEGDAFYAVIGDDGSFTLHGPPASGAGFRLSLRDDVQQTFEPTSSGAGRRDVDVNLIPTSRIQARLRVLGPVRPDHIAVEVIDGQDPSATWPSRVRTVWRDMPAWTSLLVIDVKPGNHHVVFSHEGVELLRLSSVAFPAGRASEDPRLEGLQIVTR